MSYVVVAMLFVSAMVARADSIYHLNAFAPTEGQVVVPSAEEFQAEFLGAAYKAEPLSDGKALAQATLMSTARSFDVSSGPIPGDANLDNLVNFADLIILAQNYGHRNASWQTGDFNGDQVVGFADLILLAQNYGDVGTVGIASAPLPSIAWGGLVLMGGFAAFQRGRRTLASWPHS